MRYNWHGILVSGLHICMHCERTTTISLSLYGVTHHLFFPLWWLLFEIFSLGGFQICDTVLLTTATMLDFMSPCIDFMTGSLCLLTALHPFLPSFNPSLPVFIFLHVWFKGFAMINWIYFFKYDHRVQYLRLKLTLHI